VLTTDHTAYLPPTRVTANGMRYPVFTFQPHGNIVAGFGYNIEQNVVLSTNWTCSVCFDFVKRIVRLVAFDNVATTLLLVWTGL